MTDASHQAEPFRGDELISISLTASQVELHFSRDVLQIGGDLVLTRAGVPDALVQPSRRSGVLPLLWRLVGRVVTCSRWGEGPGEAMELTFDDATVLRILPVVDGIRGTIFGKASAPGALAIEDF